MRTTAIALLLSVSGSLNCAADEQPEMETTSTTEATSSSESSGAAPITSDAGDATTATGADDTAASDDATGGSTAALAESSDSTTGEPSALQHFGFVAISCDVDDPHDETDQSDYVDEVAGFTNLAHVCPLDLDLGPQLSAVASTSSAALLDLTLVLFEFEPGTPPSGNAERLRLRADAQEFWALFVESNPLLDASHVGAFYLVDEPIWNGVEPTELETAAALVDASFPDIPILVIEAYPVVGEAQFPAGVDWVGFDRYVVADPANDPQYLADLDTLKSRARADQSLAIIFDAQWFPFYDKVGLTQDDMATVAHSYFALAQAEPRAVALIGYTWVGGIDTPDQLGARSLPPAVRTAYEEIGQAIIVP